ncbi:hypothetical protein COU80_01385 [Candidatus Peregrinibacteria bacterium CG10_big_fil_rev_8_21_14_0_10_55_24]|nr:MAG: hypothetical protein COU80_01385 [Candidatus Peregrinibacteria bacterium CG10_big_fil_rev_8_21_14_0_10_55_24]
MTETIMLTARLSVERDQLERAQEVVQRTLEQIAEQFGGRFAGVTNRIEEYGEPAEEITEDEPPSSDRDKDVAASGVPHR